MIAHRRSLSFLAKVCCMSKTVQHLKWSVISVAHVQSHPYSSMNRALHHDKHADTDMDT